MARSSARAVRSALRGPHNPMRPAAARPRRDAAPRSVALEFRRSQELEPFRSESPPRWRPTVCECFALTWQEIQMGANEHLQAISRFSFFAKIGCFRCVGIAAVLTQARATGERRRVHGRFNLAGKKRG